MYSASEGGRKVYERAFDTRESLKRLQKNLTDSSIGPEAVKATGLTDSLLPRADKYNRRLENNRKSLAASRVFKDVYKYELAHILNEVAVRSKKIEKETFTQKCLQCSEEGKRKLPRRYFQSRLHYFFSGTSELSSQEKPQKSGSQDYESSG